MSLDEWDRNSKQFSQEKMHNAKQDFSDFRDTENCSISKDLCMLEKFFIPNVSLENFGFS